VLRFAWAGAGDQVQVEEGSRRQEKVGNSGEGSNECTRMEEGRLELDQQTGMEAVDATRQDETAGRWTRTADVWRRAGRWGEGGRQGCARVT
jgi:hypothetical protein